MQNKNIENLKKIINKLKEKYTYQHKDYLKEYYYDFLINLNLEKEITKKQIIQIFNLYFRCFNLTEIYNKVFNK